MISLLVVGLVIFLIVLAVSGGQCGVFVFP